MPGPATRRQRRQSTLQRPSALRPLRLGCHVSLMLPPMVCPTPAMPKG
jgi:hypothetical protein